MLKTKYALVAGLLAAGSASAGQIQIGGVNGLTSSYVTSTGGWSERGYQSGLFSGVATSSSGLPTKTNTSPGTAAPGAQSLTDTNGIVFNLINEAVASNADFNYNWSSQNGGAPGTITVPVNVSGVQNVYVMLNDYAGYAGLSSVISFNFSGGITDTISLADLANGTGAIRSAVQCTGVSGTTITCPSSTPNGHTVSASSPATSNTNVSGDATIVTSAVWSGTYNQAASPSFINDYFNHTGGSNGNLMLDELKFSFSTNYSAATLLSISITPPSVGGVTPGTQNDRLALSAITVSGTQAVTATPEPTTVMLFGTGLSLLAFGRIRSRRKK